MRNILRITVLIAAVLIAAGCGNDNSGDNGNLAAVPVITAPVMIKDFPVMERYGGTLKGDQQTAIPAKVQTTVEKIRVKRGEAVQKGQLMMNLDPGSVQSSYRQAEAVYNNADKQWKKMQALYASGAISESQLDEAETAYKVAAANYNAARQAIEIRSSFNGIIADIFVREGDEVSPGMPLIEIADIESLRLILDIPTSRVGNLKIGQSVTVQSPLDSTRTMTGRISSIADAASRDTRSFEVECRFDDPPSGFPPGAYVIADVEIKTIEKARVVSNDAILYRSGKAMVYGVAADTVFTAQVKIQAAYGGESAITGAVDTTDRVVVVGQKLLAPGVKVQEAGK